MCKRWMAMAVVLLILITAFSPTVQAAAVPMEDLVKLVTYKTVPEWRTIDVEHKEYRTELRTGTRQVPVEKTGVRQVETYREQEVTKEVPFTKKVPVYGWVITGYYAQKGATLLRTPSAAKNSCLQVRTASKAYTCAKLDKETKLSYINGNYGQATVLYTTYGYVPKTTYTYTLKSSTQVNTKASTSYKLYSVNSRGKRYAVLLPKRTRTTPYKTGWHKASITYSNYKKVKGKWVRETKKGTVYVPSKYILTSKKTLNVWTKQAKQAKAYFRIKENARTTKTWKQTGTRTESGVTTVKVMEKIPYTEEETYTYTEIQDETYTYTAQVPYTTTTQETVLESVTKERTSHEKVVAAVDMFGTYHMTREELLEVLQQSGVQYYVSPGYDQSRTVLGPSYLFTPQTAVDLLVEEGFHGAVNLSYLTTVPSKRYEDVMTSFYGFTQ